MSLHTLPLSLPRILVTETDELCLSNLATRVNQKDPSNVVAHALLAELQRAEVVPDRKLPRSTVRMNSTVEFEIDGSETRRAKLVFPGDADIDKGRLSILTPIGAALIGLSTGQSMRWQGHDGRPHILRILSVENTDSGPDDGPDEGPRAA